MNEKIATLSSKINDFNTFIEVQEGQKKILVNESEKIQDEIEKLKEKEKLYSEVVILLQKVAEYARNQAKTQIEELVTRCLQYIMENNTEFIIEFSESRNLPVAQFYAQSTYDGYSVKSKPESSRGGGVVDIISLALRIAFLEIHKPRLEGPLFFDEPGKHVSSEYMYNLGEFLRECSNLFNRQIIMVTHNDYLSQICDSAYRVSIKNGVSKVNTLSQNE